MSDGQAFASGERRPDWAMLVAAGLLLGLAVAIAWDAANIAPGVASYSRIGPKVFPFGVAAGLAVIAGATALAALTGVRRRREPIAAAAILWIAGGLQRRSRCSRLSVSRWLLERCSRRRPAPSAGNGCG